MRSCGMNLGHRIRSVGLLIVLLLLWTLVRTDGGNVTVKAGEAATLPCPCPPGNPPFLVWQKVIEETEDTQQLVIHVENNTEKPAAEYENRVKLNWRGDSCSLVIISVRSSDAGHYRCYYQIMPITHEDIYLEVQDLASIVEPPDTQRTAVTSSICVLLVITLAAVAVCVGITYKKLIHQRRGTFIATPLRGF